jgi:hypothetical protein
MATTTTNFGWDIPQSTDLVKDGATAIAALGQDIDTAFVDLKGGTTGQVLAKASGTDLDFSWVTQDDANAIQNTQLTAKGALISAFSAGTPATLTVGTNGQVLTADSTAATGLAWATPADTSGLTLITSGSFTSSSAVNINNCFSSTYYNYKIIFNFTNADTGNRDVKARMRVSGADATGSNYSYGQFGYRSDGASTYNTSANNATYFDFGRANSGNQVSTIWDIFRPFEASPTVYWGGYSGDDNTTAFFNNGGGLHTLSTSYTSFSVFPTAGNISGYYFVYGYKN